MEASRLAGTSLSGLLLAPRWEQIAWLVLAERELHPPTVPGAAAGKFDLGAVLKGLGR